ncbi:MAG: histidine kinase dimerization/phospho-acceptor domain-containing protein, partial [Spirochaetota bacterium]
MKLQTKLFMIFSFSIFLSLVTTIPFAAGILKSFTNITQNPVIEKAIGNSFALYRNTGMNPDGKIRSLIENLKNINKEYTRLKILKNDTLINGVISLSIFLIIQGSLLLFLFFITSNAVTRQLRLLLDGMRKVESGESNFRIVPLKGYEFKRLGSEINGMLDILDEKEKMLLEQSKLIGWHEVAAFLSHQIKNPLTSISLAQKNLELLLSDLQAGELVIESLRIIKQEVDRLTSIVRRLKDLTNFRELSLEEWDVESIINNLSQR